MLRDYQQKAVDETWRHLINVKASRPLIEAPTGAGKSWILASLAETTVNKYRRRVLILTHVKELVEQNAEKARLIDPDLDVGIYSAGLKSREKSNDVVVAGIQSVYKRIHELCDPSAFGLVIIDEAHMIPSEGDGMYRKAITALAVANPKVRFVGLTATPYRLESGVLIGEEQPFDCICHKIEVTDLIDAGYLCRPVSKHAKRSTETSGIKLRNGEFDPRAMEKAFDDVFTEAVNEMLAMCYERKSVLIFASGVKHAEHILDFIQGVYETAAMVTGKTPANERDQILSLFKSGDIKFLVNVNVLTTGFDAPNCDCIVLMRATMSPGLFYQMVGRGFRIDESKEDFHVLDFGQNIQRHGPVDRIKPPRPKGKQEAGSDSEPATKACERCQTVVLIQTRLCPECGTEFPRKDPHEAHASGASILSDGAEITFEQKQVTSVTYAEWTKRGAPDTHPKTLRVDYNCGLYSVSEWICIEHEPGSFARTKAEEWWKNRSKYPFPSSAAEAEEIGCAGGLISPQWVRIKCVVGERYDELVGSYLGVQEFPEMVNEEAF